MHWRRKWQPTPVLFSFFFTPVFLPGESQGRGSLLGRRLWGRTESDTTEVTQQQHIAHLCYFQGYKEVFVSFLTLKALEILLIHYIYDVKVF